MSEATKHIILYAMAGTMIFGYIFITFFGVYYMDPDRVKRRKKRLKAKKKLAEASS